MTEVALLRMAGSEMIPRENYLVVRTPLNPTFHWGNWLIYPAAPTNGCLAQWKADFLREFADLPAVRHMTFAWDDPSGKSGDLAPFLAEGFEEDRAVVLTTTSVHLPPHPSRNLDVRLLTSDQDWQDLIELQFQCRDPKYAPDPIACLRNAATGRSARWSARALEPGTGDS